MALLHFKLPDLNYKSVTMAKLEIGVTELMPTEKGLTVVLYGLGIRGETESDALAAQHKKDYYAGVSDGNAANKLINRNFITQGGITGFPTPTAPRIVVEESTSLLNYVKEMLQFGGRGKYVAFRLSGLSSQGCGSSCNSNCKLNRVEFAAPTVKLTVY